MSGRSARAIATIAAAALAFCAAAPSPAQLTHPLVSARETQAQWAAACKDWDDWDRPGPPFRIYGNTYYVGTCGISAILITGEKGHVVIDSGSPAGAEIVAANIEKLGFNPKDVKVLLQSHEHHDHVGGIARLQELTNAQVIASPVAAAALESGGPTPDDPQFGPDGHYPPVKPDAILAEGRPVTVGALHLDPVATPGHTPGATSWQWQSCEGKTCRSIVYADSLTPVSGDGYRFSDHPAYLAAFRASLDKVSRLDCDILLSPHPSASAMRERLLKGNLTDRAACKNYADGLRKQLDERIAKEAAGKAQ